MSVLHFPSTFGRKRKKKKLDFTFFEPYLWNNRSWHTLNLIKYSLLFMLFVFFCSLKILVWMFVWHKFRKMSQKSDFCWYSQLTQCPRTSIKLCYSDTKHMHTASVALCIYFGLNRIWLREKILNFSTTFPAWYSS